MEEGGTTDDVATIIEESEFIDIIGAAENKSDFHENNTQKRRPWEEDGWSRRLEKNRRQK
jgi:hypothetical protein